MEEKAGKRMVITNVGAWSPEINAPIRVRMSDHNSRNAINQGNKGY